MGSPRSFDATTKRKSRFCWNFSPYANSLIDVMPSQNVCEAIYCPSSIRLGIFFFSSFFFFRFVCGVCHWFMPFINDYVHTGRTWLCRNILQYFALCVHITNYVDPMLMNQSLHVFASRKFIRLKLIIGDAQNSTMRPQYYTRTNFHSRFFYIFFNWKSSAAERPFFFFSFFVCLFAFCFCCAYNVCMYLHSSLSMYRVNKCGRQKEKSSRKSE